MKAVFLDIDNTLLSFDDYVREAMKTGFEAFGLKPYEPYMYDIFERENGRLWHQIEKGELTFRELEKIRWQRVFKCLDIDFDGPVFEKYFRSRLFDSAIPEEGVEETLDYLKGKYRLFAASNGPYLQQLNRLEKGGIRQYFDDVFISERAGASKPSGEFFDYAFRELKDALSPEESVMVGDSLTSDIKGALDYGMRACFYRRKRDIEPPEGVWVIDSLQEIRKYL